MAEINFPAPVNPGHRHTDPVNNVEYIYDGVKWDVYDDPNSFEQFWTRNAVTNELSPASPGDYVDSIGYAFTRIPNLP